jgi:hypothetical protein
MAESDFCFDHPYYERRAIGGLLKKRTKAFLEGYRQNVALIGTECLGKSHILRRFISEDLSEELISVYIELHREPFEYFAQRFMGALLYGLLKAKGRPAAGDLGAMISRSKRYIPKTLGRMRLIKRMLSKGRLKECYSSLLVLPRILSEETGLKILLVLDEFDRLKDFGLGDPFKDLGSELMMQKDTLFIVSSSQFNEAKEILKGRLSLLFGNFEIVEVKPLSFEESREFADLFLEGVEVKESIIRFLIQLTDGHPYYLHVILDRIKTLALIKEQSVTEHLMVQGLASEMYFEHGSLHRFFSHKIEMLTQGKMPYLYLTALLGIAVGKRRVRELSRYLERSQSDTKKILNRLVEREILVRSGSFHMLNDPLCVFWLKSIFSAQKRDLGMGSRTALEQFKTSVMSAYEGFLEEDKKELSKRIEELLKQLTREDVLEFSGKRYRCHDFSEVTSRFSSDGSSVSVLAKSPQVRWMCQIAEKPVEEEQVGAFIETLDRYKKPIKNRILLALSGIGLDAKLLAQESRINIWDLKNLNFLLSLFGKNKVIPNG